MRVTGYVARSEARHRRASLAALAVAGLVISLVVVAALAGARRTDSALNRMRAATRAADAMVQIDDLDILPEALDRVADLPIVEAAAPWVTFPTFPLESSAEDDFDFVVVAGLTPALGDLVDRPRLLAGRMPSQDAPDEVVLNELAAHQLGLDVGDRFTVATMSTDDVDTLFSSGFEVFPGFNGPEIELAVTGIARWVEDLQGDNTQRNAYGFAPPDFVDTHPDVGGYPPLLQVRLAEGTTVTRLREEVRALLGPTTEMSVSGWEGGYGSSIRSATTVLSTTLLVIVAVATAAGAVVLSQASARHLAASRDGCQRLRELGLTRPRTALAAGCAPGVALAIGVVAGGAGSVLASPLLPIGLARQVEPDPGLSWDLTAVAAGAGLMLVAALGGLAVHAWRSAASGSGTTRSRASSTAEIAARMGAGPVPVNGIRFAYGPSRGTEPVPARTVISGVALAVAGVVATALVVGSISTLHSSPERYGWTWSSKPDFESNAGLRALADEERLEAAAVIHNRSVEVGSEEMRGYAVEPVRGSSALALRSGRPPATPDEVALGSGTMEAIGVAVGDTIDAQDRQGSHVSLDVVGEVLLPLDDNTEPAIGALFTLEGLGAVARSEGFTSLVLRYPPGTPSDELEAALMEDHPISFSVYSRPHPPGRLENLADARGAIGSLAIFFLLLGAFALLHGLLIATRRHARDVAVLRTLGLVRSQVRSLMSWHAAAVAVSGLVVGLPAGLVVGRVAWRLIVSDLGLLDAPTDPWLLIAVASPVLIALALLTALVPARRMVASPAHTILSAE